MEGEDAAALAGERLRALLQPNAMPALAACIRAGADGASLRQGLIALAASNARCATCSLPLPVRLCAEASRVYRGAAASSVKLILRLGGHLEAADAHEPSDSVRDARGDVLERAGKGMRTIAALSREL